jgi:hypothetical protein
MLQARSRHCYTRSPFPRATKMAPPCSAGRTPNRGRQPPQLCQPHPIARRQGADQSARPATVFIHTGALPALVGAQASGRRAKTGPALGGTRPVGRIKWLGRVLAFPFRAASVIRRPSEAERGP